MDQNKSSIGSIIGTIIIIALIILGGLYFWGKHIEETKQVQQLTTESTKPTAQELSEAAVIKSQSSSDEIDAIETDLQTTKTTGLDTEAQ